VTGRKRVVHWTSETWCECSEIAGSPQYVAIPRTAMAEKDSSGKNKDKYAISIYVSIIIYFEEEKVSSYE
jgi:hypothetical protein